MSNTVKRPSPTTDLRLKRGRATRWLYGGLDTANETSKAKLMRNGKMAPAVHVRAPDGSHGFVPLPVLQAAQKAERQQLASGVVVATDLSQIEARVHALNAEGNANE